MIKKAWDVVSFMAVANLLALLVFVGWLASSERLSVDRLEAVRTLFAPTLAEARGTEDERIAAEAVATEAARATARRLDPPLPSAVQVAQSSLEADRVAQTLRRLDDQMEQHVRVLEERSAELDEREAALRTRQEAWETSIAAEAARKIDEQFQKTVRLYEALAGKQAKRLLLALVERGELDQAVTYVDAMSVRAAAKTIKEMKSEQENELATQLLERIRVLGIGVEVAEIAGNDDVLSAAE